MFGQPPSVSKSNQVCSFYLKGTCKYGTRCWNIHPPTQGGTAMANAFSGGTSNVFGAKTNTQQDSKEFQDFVKQVSAEMNLWERSGMWRLSCFVPLKGQPLVPGFSDYSSDELRVQAYEALKSNTSATYQTHWNELQQRYKQLREALKIPTQEAHQALREVYHHKKPQEQQDQQQTLKPSNLFGKVSGPTIFGGTTQASSSSALLGQKPQSSIFGTQSPSIFGSQPTSPSVFGGSKAVFGGQPTIGTQNTPGFGNQSSNIFGQAANNPFKSGAQNSSNTLFGSTSQGQTNTGSIFGGSAGVTPTPGQSSDIFGQNQSGTIFNNNNNTQNQSSIFGGKGTSTPTQGGAFQGAAATPTPGTPSAGQPSIFGSQQQQGIFGSQRIQQQQPSSVFGQPSVFGVNLSVPNTTAPAPTSSSVFGGSIVNTETSTSSVFGGGTTTSGGLFGNTQTTGPFTKPLESATNTGIFGKPAEVPQPTTGQPIPGLFGHPVEGSQVSEPAASNENTIPDYYTPLEQLSAKDRAEFEADTFTVIPVCPPPRILC